jgi:hypothetical protein
VLRGWGVEFEMGGEVGERVAGSLCGD